MVHRGNKTLNYISVALKYTSERYLRSSSNNKSKKEVGCLICPPLKLGTEMFCLGSLFCVYEVKCFCCTGRILTFQYFNLMI